MSERADLLRERARADFPEAWIPEREGDEFVGVFRRLDRGHTSYGPCAIAVFAEDGTGADRAVWLIHTVLRNELRRVRPEPGELVCIRYLGKRQPVGGGPAYDSYRVVVDREGGGLSWDDLEEAGPDAAGQAARTATDDIPF
jgi:hypothetical protein